MRFKLPLRIAALTREIRELSRRLDEISGQPILRSTILQMKEGDIAALVSDRPLTAEAAQRVREAWRDLTQSVGIPAGRAIVLDGIRIEILRAPENAAENAEPTA